MQGTRQAIEFALCTVIDAIEDWSEDSWADASEALRMVEEVRREVVDTQK